MNRATIVVGLGFGDCGKGSIVDYLARSGAVHTVVRFNGGPQAGHNVVTPEGQHHTFSQFGSGTLAGPATFLSRFMLIEPYALLNEAAHLQELGCDDVWERLSIDARCVVITPMHQAMNRLRELARGEAAHGTCGLGVGDATADAIDRPELTLFAGDLSNRTRVAEKLAAVIELKKAQLRELHHKIEHLPQAASDLVTILQPRWMDVMVDACAAIAADAAIIVSADQANAILRKSGEVIFEGAQGVLLDEDYGFHPHTTWSKTTPANAMQLLRDAGIAEPPLRIGVLRSYLTRHGAGPLVTEDATLRRALPEPHNSDAGRQGAFRAGVFDVVAARYAIAVAGVDELALTHLDALPLLPGRICSGYSSGGIAAPNPHDFYHRQWVTDSLFRCMPEWASIDIASWEAFVAQLQKRLAVPIRLLSFGPTWLDKIAD
jgi:adenylosuccinate synthase